MKSKELTEKSKFDPSAKSQKSAKESSKKGEKLDGSTIQSKAENKETIVDGSEDAEKNEAAPEPVRVVKWDYLKEQAGVWDFWVKAIEGNSMLQMGILEKDKPILQHVTAIKVFKSFVPTTSITVELYFSVNDFFTNEMLSFECKMTRDEKRGTELIGSDIFWKPDKNVTEKQIEIKEKQKRDKFGEKKEVKVTYQTVPDYNSFFNVFTSKKAPDGYFDNPQVEEEDEELENTIQGLDEAHDHAVDFFDMY